MIFIPYFTPAFICAIVIVFVTGLRKDPVLADGYKSLAIDNSHIVLKTKRIDSVVSLGPAALQRLVEEMGRKETSLDTFARCYSACDQILRNTGLKGAVHWHGGLIQTEGEDSRVVGTSRIDGDSAAFRQKQIEEVIKRAREVRIQLKNPR